MGRKRKSEPQAIPRHLANKILCLRLFFDDEVFTDQPVTLEPRTLDTAKAEACTYLLDNEELVKVELIGRDVHGEITESGMYWYPVDAKPFYVTVLQHYQDDPVTQGQTERFVFQEDAAKLYKHYRATDTIVVTNAVPAAEKA